MRQLLNSLYILTENAYLSLDHDNIVVKSEDLEMGRFPLSLFQNIVCFSYKGASPALMGACVKRGIGFAFCTPYGKFLARVSGFLEGNVLLRREQYRIADDSERYLPIVCNMIFAKIRNQCMVLNRFVRNHSDRINADEFQNAADALSGLIQKACLVSDAETLRGVEGSAAKIYFDLFDSMILGDHSVFCFDGRNRRPPMDPLNAMLSFGYGILANECTSAAEAFGLDSCVGFLHRDRAGRKSLALDLMEELRAVMVDRFVLSLVNTKQVSGRDFETQADGAVYLAKSGKDIFFRSWQERKKEIITHPYLKEKVAWGLVPYIQAQLLARCLRGDLDGYPSFFWR